MKKTNCVANNFWFLWTYLKVGLSPSQKVGFTFGHGGKRYDKKSKVYFKIYDVTNWKSNSCNIHNAQYLTAWFQEVIAIRQRNLVS